jgi:hypothetical protein
MAKDTSRKASIAKAELAKLPEHVQQYLAARNLKPGELIAEILSLRQAGVIGDVAAPPPASPIENAKRRHAGLLGPDSLPNAAPPPAKAPRAELERFRALRQTPSTMSHYFDTHSKEIMAQLSDERAERAAAAKAPAQPTWLERLTGKV